MTSVHGGGVDGQPVDTPAHCWHNAPMTNLELAWAAGLFDGEGCIWTRWPRRNNLVSMEMRMTCVGTMHRWHKMFGGRLVKAQLSGPSKKAQLKWTAETNLSVSVLRLLLPYLETKKASAIIALRLAGTQGKNRRVTEATRRKRDRLAGALRALNA